MFELQRGKFEQRYNVRFLEEELGHGKDGLVLMLHARSNAVKFLFEQASFAREVRAYRLLAAVGADQICGHNVPKLIRADEQLLAVELSVVTAPFLLDFVSTYTDEELGWLGFDQDVWAEREAHWMEIFGHRWPDVAAIRDAFRRHTGLHLLDLSLNNIRFEA